MDEFKYALYVEKLLNLKYAKDLEAEIRTLYADRTFSFYYLYDPEMILIYKLYALAMKLFKEKSKKVLPDMFYTRQIDFHIDLHKKLFRKDKEVLKYLEFDNYISVFEYDDLVYLPVVRGTQATLHRIIGDRKLPFKYNHITVNTTYFESYAYAEDITLPSPMKEIIANIANQISLPNGRDSTFLNIEFEQHKNEFRGSLTSEQVDNLKASIERLDLHKQAILEAIKLFGEQSVD